MTPDYPSRPPIGLYLLERNNRELIGQLRRIFNVMNNVPYDAPTVPGYSWICHTYVGNAWRYNSDRPSAGDNLRKFVIGFFNRCQTKPGS